jgi:hypothetical protein
MNTGYHLVYSDTLELRNLAYCTRRASDDNEDWKASACCTPRHITVVNYRVWMKNPAVRSVVVFEIPGSVKGPEVFSRLMDMLRDATNGIRPWRVFLLQDVPEGHLLYEVQFLVIGDEYRFITSKMLKLKELAGVVGDEHFKAGATRAKSRA